MEESPRKLQIGSCFSIDHYRKAERVTTRMWDKATHTDDRLCTEIRWQSDEVRFPPPIGEEAELRLWVTCQTIMTLAAAGGKHWFCREEHSNTITLVFWNGSLVCSLESGRGVVQAGVMTKGDSRWNEISAGGTRVEWLLRYMQGCHSTAHLGRWWEREHVPIIITYENIMGQVFWGIYPPFCFIIGRRGRRQDEKSRLACLLHECLESELWVCNSSGLQQRL